ncbi:WcaI family glycosyltransferase [Niveispirillum irakense]|uniref:WcaI family glycosyltransferase n=1 Tax=Niveispirillum irakense TaxID=34011 RepID=UPI0004153B25|nr:WcaI family glycosyltransferase [Niveispirillum irakense]
MIVAPKAAQAKFSDGALVRILFHSLNFSPEKTGIGKFNAEWLDWLQQAGHEVRIVCAPPYYPDWRVEDSYRRRGWWRDGLALRCPIYVPSRPTGLKRLVHLASFGLSSLPALLVESQRFRPDLVVTIQPTLFAAPASLVAAKLCGARSWLHVQDYEVDAAFELGILKGQMPRRLAVAYERLLMRAFDRVSSISPAMCRKAVAKLASAGDVEMLPNWVDISEISPLPHVSRYRAELGLRDNCKVVLYSGSMAFKQGLETIVDAARRMVNRPDVHFVLCGHGMAREALEGRAAGLANVTFLPLQPREHLNEFLGLADMHVLPQKDGAADSVLPSKLGGMLASGRPVLVGARPGTDLFDAVAGCGLCFTPEDDESLVSAIDRLADDPARRAAFGAAARERASSAWDRDAILGRFVRQAEALVPQTRDNNAGIESKGG